MYAANAKQSIFCYCSLPAASPEKLGYCAIKHEGLLESVNVKCDLSGSFRFSTVFFLFCFFFIHSACNYLRLVFGNISNDQLWWEVNLLKYINTCSISSATFS